MALRLKRGPGLLLSFLVLFAGCGTDEAVVSESDEADEVEAERTEREAEGWYEFEEVIGDESYAEIQLTPRQPVAGEPATLTFIAGSYYGVPTGLKVWARAGDPNTEVDYRNPGDNPPWTELTAVKAQVMDYDDDTFYDVPLDYRSNDEEQGQIHFEGELTFPTGESPVEFKIDPGWEGSQIMAFEGWRVTAAKKQDE